MKKIFSLLIFFILLLESCTEPYGLQTDTFESAIVIEATLTDEVKHQEIKLSRTYKLEENGPDMETGAVVYVTDSNGNQYNFSENNNKYISVQEFQAQPNVAYQLHVVTSDGKTYTSKATSLSSFTSIGSINPVGGLNSKGEKGVQILLNSTKTTNNIEYYRYTYEETNKIIAPHWIPERGVAHYFNPPPPFSPVIGEVYVEPWPYESKTCYATANSNEILISNTALSNSDNTVDLIRFLKVDDYKIANRYYIKVTMYNESQAAYNFYDALKKISTNGSLLSQNQPGFLSGNIQNTANPTEKVIGFFDVSHVSNQRIFFNFNDIFPNDPKPPYPYYCPEINAANELDFTFNMCFSPPGSSSSNCHGEFILNTLDMRIKTLYRFGLEKIMLVNSQCGDCTTFASNIRPVFWED
jgi:hypothetical protein